MSLHTSHLQPGSMHIANNQWSSLSTKAKTTEPSQVRHVIEAGLFNLQKNLISNVQKWEQDTSNQ